MKLWKLIKVILGNQNATIDALRNERPKRRIVAFFIPLKSINKKKASLRFSKGENETGNSDRRDLTFFNIIKGLRKRSERTPPTSPNARSALCPRFYKWMKNNAYLLHALYYNICYVSLNSRFIFGYIK